MKYAKFLYNLADGFRKNYLLVIVLMAVLAYTRALVPQFLSYTIDHILVGGDSQFIEAFKPIVDKSDDPLTQVLIVGILLVVFQCVRAIIMFCRTALAVATSEQIIKNLRTKLYGHMQNLSFSFYKKNNSGDLIQRATTDVEAIRTFFTSDLVQFTWITFIVASTLYAMFNISVGYSLITCIVVPFIFISSLYYSFRIQKKYELIDHNEGELTDSIKENITNVEVVKAFGSQKYEYDKYVKRSEPYYTELSDFFKYLARMESSVNFLKSVQILLVIVAGVLLYKNGSITVGTIVLFSSYTRLLSNPIKQLGRLLSRIGRLTVAIDRVQNILDEPAETIEDKKPPIYGNIVFDNVSYKFEDDNIATIKDVSFEIEKGTKVAILGKTGSGKSTIVNLICRLYDPTSGKILIDDVDIATINKKYLRSQIGAIVQEPYIFSRTVAENIAITNDDVKIDNVTYIAKTASVHDDIVDFKHGYETVVGEKGTTLSGGQKQRIALARTLYTDQNILIFDDSLSAVDNETDRNIRKALSDNKNLTTITITHKIQSILNYDHIIVLDDGVLIQDGTVEELLNTEGFFKETYEKQLGGDDEK